MTEKTQSPEEQKNQKAAKKRQFFLVKLVFFLALIFFGYLALKYWQINSTKILGNVKTENSTDDIFDFSPHNDAQKADEDLHDLSDLSVNELKEKGAEFTYQMLLKNQLQIADLRQEVQSLKDEILKYKNREKIGKIILTYVELRQEIFAQKNYNSAFKNFEILTASDQNLAEKAAKLQNLLTSFSNQEQLSKSFAVIIPDLIVAKNNNLNADLISKIRHNISKLIIIRKIDGKDIGDIDSIIFKIEKFLRQENYQEALNLMLTLNQNYHEIVTDFLDELSNAIEVQKLDQEILNYLKNLT